MITIAEKLENLENIKENLEKALSLYKQNTYFYFCENEIKTLSRMINDINSELMDY